MKVKRIVIIISLALIICLISSIFVFADSYEYNDVRIFVSNVQRTTIALTSNTYFGQNASTYFDVALRLSDYHIIICSQGGSIIDTGIEVSGLSQVAAVQNGNNLNVTFTQSGYLGGVSDSVHGPTRLFRVNYNTYDYLTAINLSINTSAVKLDTPTVTQNGNTITWNPIANASGYNIQYKADSTSSFSTIVTNLNSTTYSFTRSGYYVVQAIGQGNFYNSDWSNIAEVEYTADGENGGIISWLVSQYALISNGISTFWQSCMSLFNNIGQVFASITSFLPEPYGSIVWSIAGLMLIFGLFRFIV